jgi:hypothetical protein
MFWSTTLIADFQSIGDPWRYDDATTYFDQWEWTPNKGSAFPVELGIRDAAFDYLAGGDTPVWQVRFRSPTSNLGVSGPQIDDPFLNQRGEVVGRLDGIEIDLDYRRIRTGNLRLFPQTLGRPYVDLTNPTDLFYRKRTGIAGEIRVRPDELGTPGEWTLGRLLDPELSFRGDYQSRPGVYQRRFLLAPTNTWIGFSQPLDQSASTLGGGLLVVPGGAFTLDFDVDYHRFYSGPTIPQSLLAPGVPPGSKTVGFIPDTERLAGQALLHGRMVDRVTLEAGFQIARLQQVGDRTPAQASAGLTDNQVVSWSANAATDIVLAEHWSIQGLFKYDDRSNEIDRTTSLFNPTNGTQVDEFLRRSKRMRVEGELVFRPGKRQLLAAGGRYASVDRTLFFAEPIGANLVILEPNALVAEDTRAWTVYGRTRLRLLRHLSFDAEVGYREMPDTGYITDLDDYVYGEARATYTVPTTRPIQLSAFARGGSGKNRNFFMVDGIGPSPSGALTPRDFDWTDYAVGLSGSYSPHRDWSLFASVTYGNDAQDQALVLSTLQRYYQPLQNITFGPDGVPSWSNGQTSVVLGAHHRFDESTDVSTTYNFTAIDADYTVDVASQAVALIAANSAVHQEIHNLFFEGGHWLRPGLKVLVGYRLQLLDDSSPMSTGQGSVVPNLPLSVTQHTVTVGVTLTDELLKRAN